MERLTERDEYGNADIVGVDGGELQLNLEFDEFNKVTDALNRLAAYEDSGMSPEQVQELAKVKADGRLVVLPCNVGDTVWEVQNDKTIQKWFVDRFQKCDGQTWCCIVKNVKNKWKYVDRCFIFSLFGKTVFLTQEEAKKALGGGEI